MKSNKGITLVALVVTIIVLIILAGVSIAMLTGENGLLSRTSEAKVTNIEGTVKEQVRLGVAALKLYIENEAAKDNRYDAKKNSKTLRDELIKDLKETSGLTDDDWIVTANPAADTAADAASPASASLQIIYKNKDYRDAKNNDNSRIKFAIKIEQHGIKVTDAVLENNENAVAIPN